MKDCSVDKTMNGDHDSLNGQHQREQHLKLASVIKGVHKQLRRAYREHDGDFATVWEHHARDSANLQQYAQAMHELATQHWDSHPDTRIHWCRQAALDYFTGGGMRKALEKDVKRRLRNERQKEVTESMVHEADPVTDPVQTHKDESKGERRSDGRISENSLEDALRNIEMNIASVDGPIKLLDVGSCYNPFSSCPEFESIGIDLSPATENVYQCDFLKLELTTTSHPDIPSGSLTHNLCPEPLNSGLGLNLDPPGADPLTRLPEASFHVVVFSLLLEYLPAPAQRWMCCVKAHGLLVQHGLLLIVTPDSNSAYRNHPMMKSWREALEQLGFQRWKYQKLEHVHCMAFRKVNERAPEDVPESIQKLLYIPQDFSDACYDNDHLPASKRAEQIARGIGEDEGELETFLLSSAGELPLFCSDDEDT